MLHPAPGIVHIYFHNSFEPMFQGVCPTYLILKAGRNPPEIGSDPAERETGIVTRVSVGGATMNLVLGF